MCTMDVLGVISQTNSSGVVLAALNKATAVPETHVAHQPAIRDARLTKAYGCKVDGDCIVLL